jgi:pimeloyl-ACP methyl ester carboxylesterase
VRQSPNERGLKGYALTTIGQVHYCRMGQGDPVVLLPPSGRSCMVYTDLMQALSEHYLVVGIDPPGCGGSDRLPLGATIENMGMWLAEALRDLSLSRVNVFGLHSGNKLATALALTSSVSVRKLVIAGLSHSLVADPVLRRELFLKYVPLLAAGAAAGQVNQLKAWMAKYSEISALWFDQSALAEMTSGEASTRRLETLIDHMQGLASKLGLYEAILAYGFEKNLALLTMPTLALEVITPEEERLIGNQGPQLRPIIKDFRWVALKEPNMTRHTFAHRASDIAKALVDFFGPSSGIALRACTQS